MTAKDLNTAQLAIYAVLCLPVLFVLIRHGRPGFLGWIYLFAFCTLRVVGGALALSKGSADMSAAIISNIGLSPLLLALSGILHEARYYRSPPGKNTKMELVLVLVYHLLVTTGLALIASGSSAFKAGNTNTGDLGLLKGGIITLLTAWVVIATWAVFSLLPSQASRDAIGYYGGNKLLYAVLFAVPFVGIRTVYSLISILAPSDQLNPVNGSLGLRVGLSFIPELIAALALILTGLATQGLNGYVSSDSRKVRSKRRSKRGSDGSAMGLGHV